MTTPPGLRIERPYASLDAYLEGDAWTVERAEMVLIGVSGLEPGSLVSFEIVLSDGSAVVTGEARVVADVPHEGERPGGLRVRFRRLDDASKAVLRRALEARRRSRVRGVAETPSSVTNEIPESATSHDVPDRPMGVVEPIAPNARAPSAERSAVRHRAASVIRAPENREALLARLRERKSGAR